MDASPSGKDRLTPKLILLLLLLPVAGWFGRGSWDESNRILKSRELLHQGIQRAEKGDLDAAIDCAEACLAVDPQCVDAYELISSIHFNRGEKLSSRMVLQRGVLNCPASGMLQHSLGEAWYMEGDYVRAIHHLELAAPLVAAENPVNKKVLDHTLQMSRARVQGKDLPRLQ